MGQKMVMITKRDQCTWVAGLTMEVAHWRTGLLEVPQPATGHPLPATRLPGRLESPIPGGRHPQAEMGLKVFVVVGLKPFRTIRASGGLWDVG